MSRLSSNRRPIGRAAAAVGAVVVLAGLTTTACGQGLHGGTPADSAHYDIQGLDILCFEPDVFNTDTTERAFAFQLQLGDDEFSEMHRSVLPPGGQAHLHIMNGFWEPGSDDEDRLLDKAGTVGCILHVFDETS